MDDVVDANCSCIRIVAGDELAGGEHEVVADGGMKVRVVLRGQSVLRGEAVQVGHSGVADDLGIAAVFFDDQHDMSEGRNRAGGSRRGRSGTGVAWRRIATTHRSKKKEQKGGEAG